jgi:hypothetical protein
MIADVPRYVLKEGSAAAAREASAKDCDAKGGEMSVLSVSRSCARLAEWPTTNKGSPHDVGA